MTFCSTATTTIRTFGAGLGTAKVLGGSKSDCLTGGDGADKLYGKNGNDVLIGGRGADLLDGGKGFDTASYLYASKAVTANLANASKNTGDAKKDSFVSIEGLLGSAFSDGLIGNDQNNRFGGSLGQDTMTGGKGGDIFVYSHISESRQGAVDLITDFRSSQADKISLLAIDAVAGTGADDSFTWRGSKAFTHNAGELRYERSAKATVIYADVDGDANADMIIHLTGSLQLSKGDFIL